MVFFISHVLGIRTEALWATIIGLSSESVATRPAFHVLLFHSTDLILGIVAQEKVGADRIGDAKRKL